MNCRSPTFYSGVVVGCGVCLHCRINKRRVWQTRMFVESLSHKESSFATLTYADEFLPPGGSLRPRDLCLFFKRARRRVPFRYFAVGEYGDRTFRPHYHLVAFGLGPAAAQGVFPESWSLGNVYLSSLPAGFESLGYVAGYVTKKMTSASDPRLGGRVPEFTRQSRKPGIGCASLPGLLESYRRSLQWTGGDVSPVIMVGTKKLPIGRFLRGKLRDMLSVPQVAKDASLYKASLEFRAGIPSVAGSSLSLPEVVRRRDSGKRATAEARIKIFDKGRPL